MDDLISRQAAIDAVQHAFDRETLLNRFVRKVAIDALKVMPSAQPERKGNWVGIDDEPCETFECDRCGFVLDDWILGAFYNFCPNCGADMRGERDE